jgi:TRAP-type mannitol/chloroaromatic compound transport system permease large subunit
MLMVFLLGFFIDFFEIVFIVVPLLLPIAQSFGMDLVWFGVVLGANLQTSFLTPPFGFALFYLRGVSPPEVSTEDIYQGVIPFITLQLVVLALVVIFPGIVNFLPSLARGMG